MGVVRGERGGGSREESEKGREELEKGREESEKGREESGEEGEVVQRCKSAGGLCKGEKVEPEYRGRSTEDREQRGQEYGWLGWRQRGAKVQIGLRSVQRCKVRYQTGRGVAGQIAEYGLQITEERVGRGLAAPSYGGGQGEALPLPAGGARKRHARLARSTNPTSIQREAARLARSANPTKGN